MKALLFVLYLFHADGSVTTIDNIHGFAACQAAQSVVVTTTESVIPVTAPKVIVAAHCVAKSGPGTQADPK
jgi:hypothetical protein